MKNQQIEIRPVSVDDCSAYIEFLEKLDNETTFLLWEPGERNRNFETIKQRLENANRQKQMTLIAIDQPKGSVVGFLSAIVGGTRRISHRADFAMGILNTYQGMGIGSRLLMEIEKWAKEMRLKRLELTVMSHNERAIAVYKKHRFEIEGHKKQSIYVNGKPVDEIVMGKIL